MDRSLLGVSAVTLFVGCATASPGVVQTAPARADAFECAKDLLAGRGYELREVDVSAQTFEAEVHRAYPPTGAVREIIAAVVSRPEGAAAELRVSVRAFDYRPAQHGLPINRQEISEIRPSEQVVADGAQVLESCSARKPDRSVGH